MSSADAIRICSRALVFLGEEPLASFEEAGTAAVVAAANYEATTDMLLASHPWHWNRVTVRLAANADAISPAMGYSGAYTLPVPCFKIVVPFASGQEVHDWDVQGGVLYLDAGPDEVVELRYHGRVDESLFPPAFATALAYQLAAEFAVPISGDEKKRDLYLRDAALALRKAKHTSGTDRPADPIPTGRFQATRRWR